MNARFTRIATAALFATLAPVILASEEMEAPPCIDESGYPICYDLKPVKEWFGDGLTSGDETGGAPCMKCDVAVMVPVAGNTYFTVYPAATITVICHPGVHVSGWGNSRACIVLDNALPMPHTFVGWSGMEECYACAYH